MGPDWEKWVTGTGLMAYNHGNILNHSNPRYTVPNSKHAPEHREGSTVGSHRHQTFHTSRKSVETRTTDHWVCIMFYMPNCPVSHSNSFSSAISTSCDRTDYILKLRARMSPASPKLLLIRYLVIGTSTGSSLAALKLQEACSIERWVLATCRAPTLSSSAGSSSSLHLSWCAAGH